MVRAKAPDCAIVGAPVIDVLIVDGHSKFAVKLAYTTELLYPKVELGMGCVISKRRKVVAFGPPVWLEIRMLPYLLAVLKKKLSGHELTKLPLVEFTKGHFETSIILSTPVASQVLLQGQPTSRLFRYEVINMQGPKKISPFGTPFVKGDFWLFLEIFVTKRCGVYSTFSQSPPRSVLLPSRVYVPSVMTENNTVPEVSDKGQLCPVATRKMTLYSPFPAN